MTKLIEPRTLSGFRDFLPEDMVVRKKVIQIITEVLEKYGFSEIQTPGIEYQDILIGKYGEEAEKLMYLFEDQGKRKVGLRYDLTVPTARVVAQYPNLPKPFKRYQLQPAYRAEKSQKGRYREFYQFDVDTFGTNSPLSDSEIMAVIFEGLKNLKFNNFKINFNSRRILFKIMEKSGVKEELYLTAIQSIDKLDKKSQAEVEEELSNKGFSKDQIKTIFENIKSTKISDDSNLVEIFELAKSFGVSEDFMEFNPVLSRGLDYYTGIIFETKVVEPKIGSITGGGRYDKLIGQFTGQNIPAVGTTFGLDRICDVIKDLNLWPELSKTATKVLVTIFSPEMLAKSLEVVRILREEGVNTEIYLENGARLDKQLKYADSKGIPFVVIIGPDEAKNNLVTVKNLVTKVQTTATLEECIKLIGQ